MSSDSRLERLLDRWEAAREKGQEITVDELCESCPDLTREVAAAIDVLRKTDWMVSDQDDFPPLELSDGNDRLHEKTSRLQTPLSLGNYVLLERIGQGGMGEVYKARHKKMERIVALKMLPRELLNSADAIRRFQRESIAAGKLEHQNIVITHDADESDGVHFLVMQYVEGTDLSSLVRDSGPLSECEAIRLVRQAAEGLGYAHQHGIAHRDIKPSNLMRSTDGTLKILDMGLARLLPHSQDPQFSSLTRHGTVMGTADFMAPEQAATPESADERSDIYSLGCTLYFLLTGEVPYSASTLMATLIAHRESPAPRLSNPILDRFFQRLVAKRPEDRFQSMREVIDAISLLDDAELSSVAPTPSRASHAESASPLENALIDTSSVEPGPTVELSQSELHNSNGDTGDQGSLSFDRTTKSTRRHFVSISVFSFVASALILIAWLLYSTVFRIELPDGTVLLTLEDATPAIEVDVSKDHTIELTDPSDGKLIRIQVDRDSKQLALQKEGFRILTKSFDLTDDQGRKLSVTFIPADIASDVSPPSPKTLKGEVPKTFFQRDPVVPELDKGQPIVPWAMVANPAPVPGTLAWSIESAQCRGSVTDCRFSPDSQFLAVCGQDGRIRVFRNLGDEWRLYRVFYSVPVQYWLDWSPDSRYLCSVIHDREIIRIWDLQTGECFDTSTSAYAANGGTHWIGWSPTGRHLAFQGRTDDKSGILILDLATDSIQAVLPIENYMDEACWSPDGTQIATVTRDNKVRLWDISGGECTTTISVTSPSSVAWSPNGSTVAFVAQGVFLLDVAKRAPMLLPNAEGMKVRWASDDVLLVGHWSDCTPWNVETFEPMNPLSQQADIFDTYDIDCSPDNRWFVFGGSGGGVQVFNFRTAVQTQILSSNVRLGHLDWSADDKLVSIGGQQVWKVDDDAPIQILQNPREWVQGEFIGSERLLVSADGESGIRMIDVATGNTVTNLKFDTGVYSFKVSPDESKIAVVRGHATEPGPRLQVWDLEAQMLLKSFDDRVSDYPGMPKWSADGRFLALSSNGGRDFVWDVESGQEILKDGSIKAHLGDLAWSPDSDELAISRNNQPPMIWNVQRREIDRQFELSVIDGRGSFVSQVHWLGKETSVVGWDSQDVRFLVFGEANGQVIRHRFSDPGNGYAAVAFNSDETRMAASDSTNVWIHEWPSGKPIAVLMALSGTEYLPVSGNGMVMGAPKHAGAIVYVTQEMSRQMTYTPKEFADKFSSPN